MSARSSLGASVRGVGVPIVGSAGVAVRKWSVCMTVEEPVVALVAAGVDNMASVIEIMRMLLA